MCCSSSSVRCLPTKNCRSSITSSSRAATLLAEARQAAAANRFDEAGRELLGREIDSGGARDDAVDTRGPSPAANAFCRRPSGPRQKRATPVAAHAPSVRRPKRIFIARTHDKRSQAKCPAATGLSPQSLRPALLLSAGPIANCSATAHRVTRSRHRTRSFLPNFWRGLPAPASTSNSTGSEPPAIASQHARMSSARFFRSQSRTNAFVARTVSRRSSTHNRVCEPNHSSNRSAPIRSASSARQRRQQSANLP